MLRTFLNQIIDSEVSILIENTTTSNNLKKMHFTKNLYLSQNKYT